VNQKADQSGVKILVVDDDAEGRERLREAIQEENYNVVSTPTGDRALEACRSEILDVIISDSRWGSDATGLEALRVFRALQPEVEVIITTADPDQCPASKVLRAGAYHYLARPFPVDHLIVQIGRALGYREVLRENQALRRQLGEEAHASVLVGHSPAMQEIRKRITMVAASHSPVLIQGERGTGKDLVARIIHSTGPRRDQRFMPLDCRAYADRVLEVELFGCVQGGPGDDRGPRRGVLEEANGGTVLLDNADALPSAVQTELLRTLERRRLRRVGSKESAAIDIRLIAAEAGSLAKMVRQGRFREDLYERLRVIEIALPALRDRSEDIPDLSVHFLAKLGRERGKTYEVSRLAHLMLCSYAWPGNVRELRHALAWAVEQNRSGTLLPEEFPQELRASFFHGTRLDELYAGLPSLQDLGKRYLAYALRLTRGNKSEAAAILGISRKTLYRMRGPHSVWPRPSRKKRHA